MYTHDLAGSCNLIKDVLESSCIDFDCVFPIGAPDQVQSTLLLGSGSK